MEKMEEETGITDSNEVFIGLWENQQMLWDPSDPCYRKNAKAEMAFLKLPKQLAVDGPTTVILRTELTKDMCVCMCVCMFMCVYVYVHVCLCVCVCVWCVCVCFCLYMCVCVSED